MLLAQRRDRGFTLIECLIVLAVIMIVYGSLSLYWHQSQQRIRDAEDAALALTAPGSVLDLLRADPGALAAQPDGGWRKLELPLAQSIIPQGMTVLVRCEPWRPAPLRLVRVAVRWRSIRGMAQETRLAALIPAAGAAQGGV